MKSNNNYNPRPPVGDWFMKLLIFVLVGAALVRLGEELAKMMMR